MGEPFTVNTDEVRAHAGVTAGFAGRADTAAEAGAHVSTLNDAYGLFCQSFGAMTVEPQERGAQALADCAKKLHELADKLNSSADKYDQQEDKTLERLQQLLDAVDAAKPAPTFGGTR